MVDRGSAYTDGVNVAWGTEDNGGGCVTKAKDRKKWRALVHM